VLKLQAYSANHGPFLLSSFAYNDSGPLVAAGHSSNLPFEGENGSVLTELAVGYEVVLANGKTSCRTPALRNIIFPFPQHRVTSLFPLAETRSCLSKKAPQDSQGPAILIEYERRSMLCAQVLNQTDKADVMFLTNPGHPLPPCLAATVITAGDTVYVIRVPPNEIKSAVSKGMSYNDAHSCKCARVSRVVGRGACQYRWEGSWHD
jgi:hypothetical protein